MNRGVLKWMSMKSNTILDFKNQEPIQLFSIQEKFQSLLEINHSQEKKKGKKLHKEKKKKFNN